MKHLKINPTENTDSFPVAIIVSRFNSEVTEELLKGAHTRLKELNILSEDVCTVEVPGAVEIPLVAAKLAEQGKYEVIIALGAVIRGETTHYDYVCQQVSDGCQKVSLQHSIPVIFGVLTTENQAQAWDRLGGAHGHKGADAADTAVEMRNLFLQL